MNMISIIIPAYNVEKYLDQCLTSVTEQTYENLEVLLIDDGSTDNTGILCDQWGAKDQRIRVIHQENKGLALTRHIGIQQSRGEFLYFVDSDDYLDCDLCYRIMDIFMKNEVDIVSFNCYRVTETGTVQGVTEKAKVGCYSQKQALEELLLGNINNYFPNKMYKRHVFEGVDCVVGRVWEDVGTTYKLFFNAEKIYVTDEPLYYYRKRKNSIVSKVSEKALCDIFCLRYQQYIDIKERYPDTAMFGLPNVLTASLNLYDRSLWKDVDVEILRMAIDFLSQNKQDILSCISKKHAYRLYINHRKMYNTKRYAKHLVGNVVKKILKPRK